jgi:hypothetical protein
VSIGIGQPKHAERVCVRKAPNLICLSDATTGTHERYGLRQGTLGQLAAPRVLAAAGRAMARGNFQTQVTGDPKMLAGAFVIDTQGIVHHAFYSAHAGDHPAAADLVSAAGSLR